jgi:hypothetical protein
MDLDVCRQQSDRPRMKGAYIHLVPRRGLEPPPTYVDQHLKLRIAWATPPILREINGLTIGGQ